MRIGQAPEFSLTSYPVFLFFRKNPMRKKVGRGFFLELPKTRNGIRMLPV